MLDFEKYTQRAVAALGAALLTATSVIASVGPAHDARIAPVQVASAPAHGAIDA
jgi:hypothetical protein